MILVKKLRTTLLLISLILALKSHGQQDTLDPALVDAESYQLFIKANWSELIKLGNKAVKQGIDYFYLRMRIGIAYYERKNYSLAEVHFSKALKLNSGDELALEYLYYCYMFNGRMDEARVLSKKFSKELAEKTKTANKSPINFVMLEGGTKISDSTTYYDKDKKTSSNFFDPAVYFQAGLNHYIKNRISFFHALTYFDQKSFTGDVRQIQYFLKSSIPFKNNWLISPSFHWINLNFSTEIPGQPSPPPRPGQPPPPPPQPIISTTVSNYFVGSFSVQKIFKKFTFLQGNTFSNIYDKTQLLHNGTVAYSVFGNTKLIGGLAAYLHTSDNYSTINTSFIPFIYVQPINKFSVKLSYLLNKGNNIIEDNGYIVNNSTDLTKSRVSGIANLYLNKNLTFYTLYQLEFKQESLQLFNYRYNVILAGVKIML